MDICYVKNVQNTVKNNIITLEPKHNSSTEKMNCKICEIIFEICVKEHDIYGVDVVCKHCHTDNIEILLPCKHYSCKKCCNI